VKYLILIASLILAGCVDESRKEILTYSQLYDYPVRCDLAKEQLEELRYTQKMKNFPEDPDHIKTELDREFNSRLKATIWWFTYSCNQ